LVQEAKRRGAYTVEINIEPTPASASLDLRLEGPAEELLDNLDHAITKTI